MKKIQMLTQDNCPKCVALKSFLELGCRNKYADDIEVVKREDDEAAFKKIVLEHGIMSTPVLIADGEVLTDTNPSKVTAFIEKHI